MLLAILTNHTTSLLMMVKKINHLHSICVPLFNLKRKDAIEFYLKSIILGSMITFCLALQNLRRS